MRAITRIFGLAALATAISSQAAQAEECHYNVICYPDGCWVCPKEGGTCYTTNEDIGVIASTMPACLGLPSDGVVESSPQQGIGSIAGQPALPPQVFQAVPGLQVVPNAVGMR
ncbi:MAG: hypothetical protein RLO50_02165 [Azospirillaceae bacterium]